MEIPLLLTAMITPFDSEGRVDYARAEALAAHLVEHGSAGIVVAGTTGEAPTLSDQEKITMFKTVRQTVGSQAQIWAGTSFNNTHHSVELTKEAEKVGADGILAVVPYYNKPSQEGIYQHFLAMADSTSLPVMLYNIPGRTGINMLPETVARLAQKSNIIALKEAAGNLEQMAQLRKILPAEFAIYSGDDVLTLPMMALGARGVVSVASHICGTEILQMLNYFNQGQNDAALRIHLQLLALFKVLFITSNPVPLKAALQLLGLDTGKVRLPLAPCSNDEREQVRQVLLTSGYLK
ncbi:MAG: 4-hydroxy-tetrahydrodipicolinate synthase [Methylocystaceae bacterium]